MVNKNNVSQLKRKNVLINKINRQNNLNHQSENVTESGIEPETFALLERRSAIRGISK